MNQFTYLHLPTDTVVEAFQFKDPFVDSSEDSVRPYPRWMMIALADGAILYNRTSKDWWYHEHTRLDHNEWVIYWDSDKPLTFEHEKNFHMVFRPHRRSQGDEVDSSVRKFKPRLSGDGGT